MSTSAAREPDSTGITRLLDRDERSYSIGPISTVCYCRRPERLEGAGNSSLSLHGMKNLYYDFRRCRRVDKMLAHVWHSVTSQH